METLKIKRALLSVTHKEGLAELGRMLINNGVELISTGGTLTALRGANLTATAVSEVTGFPEILGGRVKTLHPHIHGGILADKDKPEHLDVLKNLSIRPFDLVCVNLYDFAGALEQGLGLAATIEEIDIGGPCLLRAAAKNFQSVLVLPDPSFYAEAMKEMERDMCVTLDFRRRMAAEAFARTAHYDSLIAGYLAK